MALSHVFTSPVADFTGTVTVFNSAGVTATTDATALVRPSNWNSVHNEFLTISGNTAGASTMSGTNIVLEGGNNVTLSANGQTLVFSGPATAAQSVQTQNMVSVQGSTGAIVFNNSNGITFGGNASTVTASHNGLTTARASNDAIGLNTAITQNGVSMTANSSGLSLNFPAFLTTAQPVGAYLTTARASTDAIGLNTAQTNVTWTANSSGLSINASGYAGTTTAITGRPTITLNSGGLQFNGSGLAGTGFTSTTTAGTAIVATNSTNGLSLAFPTFITNALTTARASNDAIGLNSAITQNGVSMTANSSGLSLNFPAFLTTAAQVSHSHGNPTLALTNLTGTTASASNGLTISLSAAAGGGAAISGGANSQNTGTVNFANSNNVTFGLSNNGTMTASIALAASNSAGSFTFNTLNFSNANNVTFGTSAGGIITASVAAPGAAAENNWVTLLGANVSSNSSASGSTIGWSGSNITLAGTNGSQVIISAPATSSLSATGQVSISTNGSTISIGVPNITTASGSNPFMNAVYVIGQPGQHSIAFAPLNIDGYVQFDRLVLPVLFSNASNSSNSWSLSLSVGIFSRNVSSLSLIASTSTGASGTASGSVGSYSIWGAPKLLTIGMTSTIGGNDLYVGVWSKTSANAGGQTLNLYLQSQVNSNFSGIVGVASSTHQQQILGLGHYSATFSSAMPAAFSISQIQGTGSLQLRSPIVYFASQTV